MKTRSSQVRPAAHCVALGKSLNILLPTWFPYYPPKSKGLLTESVPLSPWLDYFS